MKSFSIFSFLVVGFILFSCTSSQETPEENSNVIQEKLVNTDLLDSVIMEVQTVLISNLTKAIDEQGIESAALFCAEKAQGLTDSMSKVLGYKVRRISDRNRNTANDLDNYEKEVFLAFKSSKENGTMIHSQVNESERKYYKPILLGMPLCLKCHGSSEDRDEDAYAVISEKYPNDKAINYTLGELRGMWVVQY